MRMLLLAGSAIASLCFSPAIRAACEHILAPPLREISTPGSYCLDANRDQPIVIRANDVDLDCRGRTLTHRDDEPWANYGVHVDRVSNVTVRNCRLQGWNTSIALDRPTNVELINNTIDADGPAIGVFGDDRPDGAVRLTGNRIFYYNARNGADTAISVNHTPQPVLTNNIVAGFRGSTSVYLNRSPDAQLTGNQFLDLNEGGAAAVRIEQSPRARLVHNTVMLRRGVDGRGLVDADEATCIENVFINTVHSGLERCVVRRYNVEQISND
ncbi:MAG: NosD domain-containing protein [Lysobacter sp.]